MEGVVQLEVEVVEQVEEDRGNGWLVHSISRFKIDGKWIVEPRGVSAPKPP